MYVKISRIAPSAMLLLTIVARSELAAQSTSLEIRQDEKAQSISVFREGQKEPILTQNARADFRPYLHPIVAPDGKGLVTQYSPGHHRHQTGIYWGFTRVNGRDYFHHPEGTHWKRVSASIVPAKPGVADDRVRWKTVYDMLDKDGGTVLTETQSWSMREANDEYVLELVWQGEAKVNVTIGKYAYGGLFLRMPWYRGIPGAVVNGARQVNRRAEGQRSIWVDIGMQVKGRDDLAHIAVFDHPKNAGFPQPWRVDGQMGVGPVRARLGDWHIAKGKTATIRHQLRVYTGELDDVALTKKWSEYTGQRGTWAQWGLAQREGRAAKFLKPEEAVKKMTTKPGFEVNAARPWATPLAAGDCVAPRIATTSLAAVDSPTRATAAS